jgi:hypothetical protein
MRSHMPVMTSEMVLIMGCPDDAGARRKLEEYALTMCDQARKHGWEACAAWADDKLRVRFQDGDADEMREFLDPLAGNAKENGATSSIFEEQPATAAIGHLHDVPFRWGEVVHARLTRELISALPEGAYVASVSEEDRPASIGRLGPFHVRAQQWQRAQLAGLDGGLCRVFWSGEDYDAFLNSPNEDMR